MTITRDQLSRQISDLVDGRPVRWADPRHVVGDYDGRERTLEIFNADVAEQLTLLRRLEPIRPDLEAAVGGPVVTIFHTRRESARLHAAFVEAALRSEVEADVAAAADVPVEEDVRELATDIPLRKRDGDQTGTGSHVLPRGAKAA